jgi:hypothetical protein
MNSFAAPPYWTLSGNQDLLPRDAFVFQCHLHCKDVEVALLAIVAAHATCSTARHPVLIAARAVLASVTGTMPAATARQSLRDSVFSIPSTVSLMHSSSCSAGRAMKTAGAGGGGTRCPRLASNSVLCSPAVDGVGTGTGGEGHCCTGTFSVYYSQFQPSGTASHLLRPDDVPPRSPMVMKPSIFAGDRVFVHPVHGPHARHYR